MGSEGSRTLGNVIVGIVGIKFTSFVREPVRHRNLERGLPWNCIDLLAADQCQIVGTRVFDGPEPDPGDSQVAVITVWTEVTVIQGTAEVSMVILISGGYGELTSSDPPQYLRILTGGAVAVRKMLMRPIRIESPGPGRAFCVGQPALRCEVKLCCLHRRRKRGAAKHRGYENGPSRTYFNRSAVERANTAIGKSDQTAAGAESQIRCWPQLDFVCAPGRLGCRQCGPPESLFFSSKLRGDMLCQRQLRELRGSERPSSPRVREK